MMEGWHCLAAANRARTSFSPSPTNLDVRVEAEMLKKAESDSLATALASIVLPFPAKNTAAHQRAASQYPGVRTVAAPAPGSAAR